MSLRADPHAQYEIRVYADAILDIVTRWVPVTAAAFTNHVLEGVQLSGAALGVVRRLVAGETLTQTDSGLSKREWDELMSALGREI